MSKILISTIVVTILSIILLYVATQFNELPKIVEDNMKTADIKIDGNLSLEDKRDCEQARTYCFEDSDCARLCTISSLSQCRNGMCINSAVINTSTIRNECNAASGVVTFFVGNATLGRYEFICKSIDPGIAPNDITLPNKMCLNGNININYLNKFPTISDCTCPVNYLPVIIPKVSQIRERVECAPADIANKII